MFKSKIFISSSSLFVVALILGAIFFNQLPDQLPIHYDSQGIPNGYASKSFAIFIMPIVLFLFHAFLVFVTQKDPKYKNMPTILVHIVYMIIPLLTILIQSATIYYVLVGPFNISSIISFLVGFILIFIGNYLPKCKQNMTLGIRTPWTLYDEDNWNKTNRLGGICFVVAGVLTILTILLSLPSFSFIAIIIISALIPLVYSYLLYNKTTKE